jgi:hypothetical protein
VTSDTQNNSQNKRKNPDFGGYNFLFFHKKVHPKAPQEGYHTSDEMGLNVFPSKTFPLVLEKTTPSCHQGSNAPNQKGQPNGWEECIFFFLWKKAKQNPKNQNPYRKMDQDRMHSPQEGQ